MLSYRHSFHAGNFADVIKHVVLVEILEYLVKKDKPFDFIDTHAGAGLYNLRADRAAKTQEYTQGVSKLKAAEWPELKRYFEIIGKYNARGQLVHYPGSPMIAMDFLRAKDHAWFYELHPADFKILVENTAKDARVKAMHDDGYKGLLALVPPKSRRGVVLLDPPYEIKTDYNQVVDVVIKAHRKFSTGTYAVWYPVVERKRIEKMEARIKESGIRNIHRFELAVAADTRGKGMTGAGMIVINPPWTLTEKMSQLLPRLVATLGHDGASYRCDELVGE